jgi:peptidoglycan/LPS O-acetylase OafA/YrhL
VIKRLLVLNGLAAVCAVINHAVVWELTAMFWWADRYLPGGSAATQLHSLRFFTAGLVDQLVFFAVFAFLFISGFFIPIATGRTQKTIPWRLVFQRVKFLIIPYILWSVILILMSVALQVLNIAGGKSYTPWEIIKILLTGGASPPYYYVILIVQLYLISPFLVPLARERWKLLLVVTGLLQAITLVAFYGAIFEVSLGALEPVSIVLRYWHLIGYTFWFALGMVIGFHLQDFRSSLYSKRWYFLAGTVVCFVVGFLEWGAIRQLSGREWSSPQVTFFNRLFVLFLLLSFVAFENYSIPFSSLFSGLGPKSYGIYLVHAIPMEMTARLVYHVAPKILAYQIIFMPLLITASIGLTVALMALVDLLPSIRPYHKYIFG